MGMGFIDSFPFSLGSFAILDDLTDCSSETVTFVERRRSSSSQDKAKSRSKQSTTTAARAHVHEHVTSRHGSAAPGAGAATVIGPETARSTTVANLNVKEKNIKLRGGAATNVSAKRSIANETIAKRSTVTAPAAPGREPPRRPRHERREGDRDQKSSSKKEEVKQETKKEETNIELITTSKDTVRSVSRSQIKSREPSHAPQPSEVETRPDVSSEELRKENRALRRRTERLEKDLAAYRRHVEHYRERRREADRVRSRAEERVRELETVVTNMRDSYEQELDNLRNQITEYAAKAAAVASATQLYAKDITGETEDARSKAPSVKKVPSLHELAVQTDPWPIVSPPPRPSAPVPGAMPPTLEGVREATALLTRLQLKDAELVALRFFHEETPQITLDTLKASVRTLNTELRSLALGMARDVRLSKPWGAAQAWALEAAEPGLARCLRLLSGVKGADFSQDVTLVRLALQSWIVSCLQRVFEKFLFGLENDEDEMLRRVFERVQRRESPPVAARWRALTHRHARILASLPMPSPSTAGGGYSAARDHAIHLLEMDILVGAEAILRFSGAHSPPGALLQELSREHGRRISRVVKRAAKLANDLAERSPVGCEVFIVHVGEDASEHGPGAGMGMALCGCMESVDQECRQWVGQTARTERGGRTAGTRTHTRAGTVRKKSKTRSHARTATTRTWADTIIRQWDRDTTEEDEDDSDEDEEEIDDEEEDQFAETIDGKVEGELVEEGDEGETLYPTVLCSLGFGLRRIIRRPRHRRIHPTPGPRTQPSQETLQHERRRVPKPEVETLHGSQSDAKSIKSFTITSLAPTSPLTSRTARYRRRREHEHEREGEGGEHEEEEVEGREVDVLVKTDVLVSTTVDSLRQRVVQ
ncbi:hypothetical protein A7U60_g1036 [Sanghuangporus baumii]|uniref:Uncharacterized protein n=1 Tax=Sanghuangporus baumii TaxID=108892 RepID=A0A9Q5I5F4_SANBA|nr:hypothetical protein A7U60_g1036 [Sanghuangporus baumii]